MNSDLPAWTELDPGATPSLASADGSTGRVVALVVAPAASRDARASEVALGLARGWGRRFVAADAGLATPTLHAAAEVPLEEGLSDMLLWGASIRRVAWPLPDGGFLIGAGTVVADAAAALADPRWHTLCSGFREAGAIFAVVVPSSGSGLASVLDEADDVVVIAADDEDASAVRSLPGLTGKVRAVVGPGASLSASAPLEERGPAAVGSAGMVEPDTPESEDSGGLPVAAGGPEPLPAPEEEAQEPSRDPEEGEEGFSLWAEPEPGALDPAAWSPVGEHRPADGPWLEEAPEPGASRPETPEPETPEPETPEPEHVAEPLLVTEPERVAGSEARREDPLDRTPPTPSFEEIVEDLDAEPRSPRSRTVLLLALLLVVAGAAVAGWMGWVEVPGITPARGGDSAPTAVAVPSAPSPPSEVAPVQEFSVALGAYQDGGVADRAVASMRESHPDVLFVTAPVEVNGTLVHRVLAGPAPDSAGALEMADRIARASGLDPTAWVARRTPQAFQLGQMPELEAARRRVEVLIGLGIPAYILAVDYDDGSVHYRVYAGAYADETEASYLSGLLQERGLSSAILSARTGRLPE